MDLCQVAKDTKLFLRAETDFGPIELGVDLSLDIRVTWNDKNCGNRSKRKTGRSESGKAKGRHSEGCF